MFVRVFSSRPFRFVKCIRSRFCFTIDTVNDKMIVIFVIPVKEKDNHVCDLSALLNITHVRYLFSSCSIAQVK